jgi:hypothetical protein
VTTGGNKTLGRPRHRHEYTIKMYLNRNLVRECELNETGSG